MASVDAYEEWLDTFVDPKTGLMVDDDNAIVKLYNQRNWSRLKEE